MELGIIRTLLLRFGMIRRVTAEEIVVGPPYQGLSASVHVPELPSATTESFNC
jgi:hypothetical protein